MPGEKSSRRSRSRSRSSDRDSHRHTDSREYRVRIRGRMRDTREVLQSSGTAPLPPPPASPALLSRLGSFAMMSPMARGVGARVRGASRWTPGWVAPRGFPQRRVFVKPPVPPVPLPASASAARDSDADTSRDRGAGVTRNMLLMEVNPTYVPRGRFFEHDNRDDLDYEEDRRATDRERVAAWRTRGWRPPPREWRDRPPARRFREAPAREPEREREGQRERESEREPTAREPENNKSEADADDDGEPAPKRSNLDTIPRRTYMDWEEDRHDSRPSRGGRAMWTGKWQRTRDPVGHWSHDKFDELEGDEEEEEDQHASNDLPSARKPAAQTIT